MPAKLKLTSLPQKPAAFIEPMDCLAVTKLPDSAHWVWEIKIDGYRAIAVKNEDRVKLYSRTRNSFNSKFNYIADALNDMPIGTVLDGELVAIDDEGRPNFNLLQNFRTGERHIQYYVFDLLSLNNRDTTRLPLLERRKLLKELTFKNKRIKLFDYVEAAPAELLRAVREQKLEGIVGKRKGSLYEPGARSGAWIKYRVNRGQEFVIGGYTPGLHGLDAIIIGYYGEKELVYVARTRNGFVPASRRQLFEKLKPLVISKCPFVNLPEKHRSRWGEGMTAEEMKKCVWVEPKLVAQIEFLEWTAADHLRHSKFVGLREDKDPRSVVKEHAGEVADRPNPERQNRLGI
jgi:bifunctional non-homologous end joining protein LigD